MKEISLASMRWKLFLLGVFKIPMIHFVRPKLLTCSPELIQIKIPFRRRTKNHLNSMYFGALNIGADLAAGLFVYYHGQRYNKQVTLAFKSAKSQFLKRPESDVVFSCLEGPLIVNKIEEAINEDIRINFVLPVSAKNSMNEEVALFDMEVSIRIK